MVSHSSILAWKVSWTKEPGGPQSIRSQRGGHDWACILDPIGRSHFSHPTQMQKYILNFFLKLHGKTMDFVLDLDFSLSFPWEFNEGIDFHGHWRGQARSASLGAVSLQEKTCAHHSPPLPRWHSSCATISCLSRLFFTLGWNPSLLLCPCVTLTLCKSHP